MHTRRVDIPHGELADVVKRLKRIEGQIGGIVRMIEEGRDCSAVVTQLAAASKALSKAGFAVVSTGMRYCSINEDGETREVDLRELERLFLSLA
ncbi:transcriptional regulator [Blastococcus sp. CT_GayMR19]|nr:transcriptional regulator [Blastococcus sp. CT_GayMR19]